jgi:hypothetical protein
MKPKHYATNTLLGALQVAVTLLTSPLSRRWYNRWGSTPDEVVCSLPGDDLVPAPQISYTRAITIHAPAAAIWPWLVQMGQGRGGLYSYDGLENLIGCDIHSADRILPEFQELKPGDHVLFGPAEKKFPGQVVLEVEPGRSILMCALDPVTRQPVKTATWVFFLDEIADGATRLLVRGSNGYEPTTANHILWHTVESLNFVMERKMLRGIKARVEDAQLANN